MAIIYIDQKPYEVDQRKNLLESAVSLGLNLPYFCWHPALGSVGSCRLCAVQQFADENDTQGRTVMACMTPVKDNMRFSVEHATCSGFRESVTEWLMNNHPHDCPVCDEGGECHLQDMTLLSGHNYRRYRFPKRTFRNQNLGPFINHEMNRCITCYRCVRYYKDVAGGTDLSAFASSGRVYFGRFEEGALQSEFSGNLAEVCPTGVFTDKIYHKRYVRKWDLTTAPSVCQLCSVGCNISPGERGGILRRVQNRFHEEVNGFFICDRGRFGHDFVNAKNRLLTPQLVADNNTEEVSLDAACMRVQELIAKSSLVVGIGSPRASLESNWMLKQLVGADNFYDGLTNAQSTAVKQGVATLTSGTVEPASLKDLREADAIFILGEDLTQTAPMMALSIRQGAFGFKQAKAEQDLGISVWNDAAVRDYVRADALPLFVAHVSGTALDSIAHARIIKHPAELLPLAEALLAEITGNSQNVTLSETERDFIASVKTALLAAKKPVIIAGTSLGDGSLIAVAEAITRALDREPTSAKLSLVFSDANSVGLSMLKPKPLSSLLEHSDTVDVAIVLEHDLRWHLGSKPFKDFVKRITHLVVIDSLPNETVKHASVVIPSLTFLESTGCLISGEGRVQRFFSVSQLGIANQKSAWRILSSCMGASSEEKFPTADDVCNALALDLGLAPSTFTALFTHDFTVLGRGVPRQTSEFSGRTAMYANTTVHEPKPRVDPDSPLVATMEGPRTKIPLPLISSSWSPAWNSVQASFKTTLKATANQQQDFGGVRIFEKHAPAPIKYQPVSSRVRDTDGFYVVPNYSIFASSEIANFSPALSQRFASIEAQISHVDARRFGFSAGATIIITSSAGKFSLVAKTRDDLAPGILLLSYGLVDASLFFTTCTVDVVSEEKV